MKEYELLRTEILDGYNRNAQYENLMYTVVAAILVFALQADLYLICLLPYTVIIPVFFLVMNMKQGICKIAAYMIVFLEGDEFHWETMLYELDRKNTPNMRRRLQWKSTTQYYLLSLSSSSSAVYKIFIYDYTIEGKWVRAVIVAFFTLLNFPIRESN